MCASGKISDSERVWNSFNFLKKCASCKISYPEAVLT